MKIKIFDDGLLSESDKREALRNAEPYALIRAYAIALRQFDPLAEIDDSVIVERELMRRLVLLNEIKERMK